MSSQLLQQLRQRMPVYQPVDLWKDPACFRGEAAVLIAVTTGERPEIILTRRADTLNSHRGEVALPGGRIDTTDSGIVHAALRESHEEVGLSPGLVEVLGQLDPMVTRFGMKVTPVVGLVPDSIVLTPNPHELDAVFRVPLTFFLEDKRLRTDIGTLGGHSVQVPCWQYERYEIWGVTAVILVMLMNTVFDRGIDTGMAEIARKTGGKYMPQDWREVSGRKGIIE